MKVLVPALRFPAFQQFFTFGIFLVSFSVNKVISMTPIMEPAEPLFFSPEKLPESRPLQITRPEASSPLNESQAHAHSSMSLSSTRESKLFPYFLVQFPNDPCSNTGGTQHGICVSAKDCKTAEGNVIGRCAQGFGACCKCTVVKTCGAEGGDIQVRENSTELRAGNGSGSCRFILPKIRGICQVRLEFTHFEFGKPMSDGSCTDTKLNIVGSNENFPNLCGNLTGQHLFLNYRLDDMDDKILVYVGESSSPNDTFSIQIHQFRCDSRQLVPRHCSQYYTGKSGQVRSLNWPHQQLNSQEYTICVADQQQKNFMYRSRGRRINYHSFQKINWSTCGSSYNKGIRDFFISGKTSDAKQVVSPDLCEGTDYIQVFGGNKQCGNLFQNETVSTPPYLLRVRFDEKETTFVRNSLPEDNVVVVAKPEKGCKPLDTNETSCVDSHDDLLCKCTRTSRRTNSTIAAADDEGNTGFCLSYKIIE